MATRINGRAFIFFNSIITCFTINLISVIPLLPTVMPILSPDFILFFKSEFKKA